MKMQKKTGEQLENLVVDIVSGYGKVLNNLYIPCGNNNTTEVDVVLVNSCGVFVFECKNYSGWIFGGYKQEYWTQCLPTHYGESNKIKFYNPISQNYTHIRNLRKIVGSNIPIYSIIVFGSNATFKTQMPNSDILKVINVEELFNTMTLLSNKPLKINNVDSVYNKLLTYTNVSDTIKSKHIEFVNTIANKNVDETAKHKNIGFVNTAANKSTLADTNVECYKVEPQPVQKHAEETVKAASKKETEYRCETQKMEYHPTKIAPIVVLVLIIALFLFCILFCTIKDMNHVCK